MRIKLAMQAILKYIFGIILVGLLLFIPAKSIEYWNGWLFIGLLFIPMLILGIILFIKNPELLEKRLNSKEKENTQKIVLFISAILFIAVFIISGLNYRYNWNNIPAWLVTIASITLLISYGMYAEVMRENTHLLRTIGVEKNQKVIETGLYGVVRHPMYLAVIFLFLSIPIILGCWYAFCIFLIYPIILIIRIINEEKVLEKEMEGYKEYKKKVKYRLIPFIW